ncbi:MAG: PASTA domain-containing protein, partial [Bacteroidota bacterium]
ATGQSTRLDRSVRLDAAPQGATPEASGGEAAALMPDVRGLSVRRATAWLRARGVSPRITGSGVVRRQSVAPGAALPSSVTLTAAR